MDRNGRYTYIRRQGQQQQHQQQQQQQQTLTPSSSSNMTDGRNPQSTMMPSREPVTQHDELIRYIKEAWHKVKEQEPPVAVIYRNETDQLKNFKPFDLEEYWGQRLVQNFNSGHQ